jgi:hypothetical protein
MAASMTVFLSETVLKKRLNDTGAKPMITSYNTSVVKIYNATNSIARF